MITTLDQIMHHKGVGVLYLDVKAKILGSNQSANNLLAREKELRCRGNKLVFNNAKLRDFFDDLFNKTRQESSSENLFIKRSVNKPPLKLSIHTIDEPVVFDSGEEAVSLLFVTDTMQQECLEIEALTEHFALTAAEVSLVLALHEGYSLHEHANNRGVKITTIRWTLDNVFSKTYTNSQSQLKQLISKYLA